MAPLLALFPSNDSRVDSYFWCTPGVQLIGNYLHRFDAHMNAFATNALLETHCTTSSITSSRR